MKAVLALLGSTILGLSASGQSSPPTPDNRGPTQQTAIFCDGFFGAYHDPHHRKSIEVRLLNPFGRIVPSDLWPLRNVWSAAVLQAKNENDIVGLRECIRPLCELLLWALMECAAPLSYLVSQAF